MPPRQPIIGGLESEVKKMGEICVLCLICDKPIPVVSIRNAYPKICPECKMRLKEILYGNEGET